MVKTIQDTMCHSGFKFIGFYYKDKDTDIDKFCECGFLGNFYASEITYNGKTFQNAEAAFQACKWWQYADKFTKCKNGDEAFRLKVTYDKSQQVYKKDLQYGIKSLNTNKFSNANLQAMYQILQIKFQNPEFGQKLHETEDYLLIEHNETEGRDSVWSNNYNGLGSNALGLLLMIIRHENREKHTHTQSQKSFYNKLINILPKLTGGKPPNFTKLYDSDDTNIKYWKAIVSVGTYLIKDILHTHTPIGNHTGSFGKNSKILLYGGLTYALIKSDAEAFIKSLLGKVTIKFIQSYNQNEIIKIVLTEQLKNDKLLSNLKKPLGYEFHKSSIDINNS